MAKIYGQLEKAQLENTTSDTASLPKGTATYRTDLNQMKVSNGTAMKAIIDEDSTQTMANKTLTTPVIDASAVVEEIPTPANPSAGYHKIYFKSDGKFYRLNSSGVETEVGAGAGVPTYSMQEFLASDTWNVPAGVNWVIIEAYGGGGGGADGPSGATSGGGGGGGAGAIAITRAVTPGETITVTIGAGGLASTGPTDGGTTVVSSATLGTLNFYGGLAAMGTASTWRFGGKGSGCGGDGGNAFITVSPTAYATVGGSSQNYQGGTIPGLVGPGGGGAGGGGNGGAGGATGTAGAANSGAGGGGGTNLGAGGNGGSGRVRIYYYV